MNRLTFKYLNSNNTKNIKFLLVNKAKPNNIRVLTSIDNDLRKKRDLKIITNKRYFNLTLKKLSKNDQINNNNSNDLIFTIPNILTVSRIASIPFISYFLFMNQYGYASGLFVLAAVTDFLDGFIARNFPNQQSNLGSILDPLADKLLVGTLTITLAMTKMLPIELAILIIGRDLALVMASLIIRFKSLDKPVTIEKFINVKKYASVKVEADLISKINTFLQLSLITLTLPSVLFGYEDANFLLYFQYLTGLTTILSSISYLYKGGSYKLLKK